MDVQENQASKLGTNKGAAGFVCEECKTEGKHREHNKIIDCRYNPDKKYVRRRRECYVGHVLATREYAQDSLKSIYSRQIGIYCKLHTLLKAMIADIVGIVGYQVLSDWKRKNEDKDI